ncbi:hypothetical protein ACVXFD_003418, partial [Escherichia coli]
AGNNGKVIQDGDLDVSGGGHGIDITGALYLPFLFLPESNASLVILMLFCTILTEFCGLLAQTINGVRSYAGPFGKSDRALIFGLWGLAVAIYPQWMQWNNLLWSIASILLLWTAINRCRSVLLMSAEI